MRMTCAFAEEPALRASKIPVNFRLSAKMKKTVAMLLSILSVLLLAVSADAKQVRVKGYYRKNGTYVSPHVRNVGGGSKSSHRSYSAPSRGTHSYHIPSYSTPSRGTPSYNTPSYNTPSYNTPSDSTPFDSKSSAEKTSFDTPLDSLPRCQAVNEDGSSCKRPANPGLRYCYRHVGNSDAPKNEFEESLKAKTLQWMTDIDDAIKRYIGPSKRPPPESLKELQTQMGAIVSRLKDAWGASFHYETDGIGYTIASNGPDGKFGTDDDISIIRDGSAAKKEVATSPSPNEPIKEPIPHPGTNTASRAAHIVNDKPVAEGAIDLSIGDVPITQGISQPSSHVIKDSKTRRKPQNPQLAVGTFLALMVVFGLGFAFLSHCTIPNKIVRIFLTVPGIAGAALLIYWYVPVRQSPITSNQEEGQTSAACVSWSWSATPNSRLLFVCSRERIKGDCVQLVLNGESRCYAGIGFPKWLTVPSHQTVSVTAKFDSNEPLKDPWIRAKDGSGIHVPWPVKDFIEAVEESKDFGVTFKDNTGAFYTFTFDVRRLRATLGPDRKYFMRGK